VQDCTVLDVGANLGTHTLGLARYVGGGAVHAFEPQRIICNMLAGSVALNGLLNVHCHNVAIGAAEALIEVPQFDYDAPLNFGSIEFGAEQREPLDQPRGRDRERVERVQQRTIDSYDFDNVELIKLDVEGMEQSAIEGAGATIDRCRPVLYVEYLKSDRDALERQIARFDYAIHVHGDNLLCLPHELRDIRI
jgi:FkbM family methyltransferase